MLQFVEKDARIKGIQIRKWQGTRGSEQRFRVSKVMGTVNSTNGMLLEQKQALNTSGGGIAPDNMAV